MNDKFFELPMEKQNRFINSAYKIFAENGYKKASTDDIVKDAGISKGLLFHYFGSKQGLYEFVYNYGVKYILMEYSHILPEEKCEFFSLQKRIAVAQKNILQTYPYMLVFVNRAFRETDIEVMEKVADVMDEYSQNIAEIYSKVDVSDIVSFVDPSRLLKMCIFLSDGIMNEQFQNGVMDAQSFLDESLAFLEMLEQSMKISL